jgi:hypothetical protein
MRSPRLGRDAATVKCFRIVTPGGQRCEKLIPAVKRSITVLFWTGAGTGDLGVMRTSSATVQSPHTAKKLRAFVRDEITLSQKYREWKDKWTRIQST